MIEKDVIIVGGGAAGFFAAINIAEQNPHLKVAILERGKEGLAKSKSFWWRAVQCHACRIYSAGIGAKLSKR